MAPQLLKDLATHSRKWIIQCRVARKWIATNCNTGKVLHMDMVLLDSEGSDIWAMVPPLLISKFESSLKEQEVGDLVKVTLWGSIGNQLEDILSRNEGEAIILSITSVFVDEFKGDLCLSSTGATQLNSNLDIPEVHAFNAGETTLTVPVLIAEVPPVEIPKISIAQLNDFKTMEEHTDKLFAIEGKVIQVRPNWCYMGCAVCPRKVEEDLEEYFCGHCKTTSSIAKAKFRVKLQVQDDTGEADFAILEHEAEYYVASVDHDPLQQVTKIPDPVSVGGSTSCGLKRKHDDDADPEEE
ncbi:unnamed protein product [Linum tenue]|uniref:Replication factor A C-terminal domain-containing protein n=1 Tax=Linum tenue TaxID=586396 RepID=A0AAV0KRM9_9ROSI|nr:unnamed protein product [Linum tenue]